MARTRAPAALATPEDVARAETAVAPQREALQQFQTEESRLMGDVRRTEEDALKAKEARDIAVKESEATQLGLSAEQQRGLTEKTQSEIEKNPFPTFKPSQEDAVSYSQLGSLVGTLGMMLGGGAKGSAKVAIGAMTGMMKGWQTGRKELWEREVKTFDKEVQRIKSEHNSIYKDLDMGLKQLATDREAGRAKLMSAAYKAGTGSVIATLIQNGRAQDALKIVREGYKLTSDIDKRVQDLAIAQRRHEDQLAAQAAQRNAMVEAARIREQGRRETAEKKVGSIGKIAEGKLEAKSALVKQYDALIEDYETNKDKYQLSPGLRTALTLIPGGGSASEKIMSVARANPDKYPNAAALSQFIGKLESVIAPDRHSLYGANLTANELPRYERTVPRVTDDPKVFLQFLESNRKSAEDSLRSSQDFYARRGVDLRMDEIYDKAQPFIATRNGTPKFNTLQEAEAAGLPSGTKIIVGGRSATVE
jgi:hypothetical protein